MSLIRITALIALATGIGTVSGCGAQSIDQGSPPPPSPGAPPPAPPPPPPLPPPPPPSQVTATVSVDANVRYQKMKGWEATSQAGQDDPAFANFQAELMDLAANDLGINRIRLEVRSGAENPIDWYGQFLAGTITQAQFNPHRYEYQNDNFLPLQINPAGFHFTELDRSIEATVLPMRQRLAARGEALYVSLNYVSFANSTAHSEPAEYAEFIFAAFQHIQTKYGFVPDAVEVILEPDNNSGTWNPAAIGRAVASAGARLAMEGFHPAFIAPSVTNMANTVPYVDQIAATPLALNYLTDIAYHRYSGVSDANLSAIRARAAQLNVGTAMLEHIGSDIEDLYKDLTIANVSAWQQYTLAYPTSDNGAQYIVITNGRPALGFRSLPLRQYFRYVRIGADRIGATSDTPRVRPVAFLNPGAKAVVVLHTSQGEVMAVNGLPAGTYAVSAHPASAASVGTAVVGSDGQLRFTVQGAGVVTVYRLP